MHLYDLFHGFDAVLSRFRFIEERVARPILIIAGSTMWSGPVFVEGSFDLNPSGLQKITKGRFFLAWVNGVQSLLADDLADQFCRVGHNLITENHPGAPSPDILG